MANYYESKHTGNQIDRGIYKTKFMGYFIDQQMYNPTELGNKPATTQEKQLCLMTLVNGAVYQDLSTGSFYTCKNNTLVKVSTVSNYSVTGSADDGTEAFNSDDNEIDWTKTTITLSDGTSVNTKNLVIGDNFFVDITDKPDRWVSAIYRKSGGAISSITFSKLETQKIDLNNVAYVNENSVNRFVSTNSFAGPVGNQQTQAGVYLGVDGNPLPGPNAHISIISDNNASYIDFGKPNNDYSFRIIKWDDSSNTNAQFVYDEGNTLTLPRKTGILAVTTDIPDITGKVNKTGDTMTGSLTIGTGTPLQFTGVGSGTYNKAAFVCNINDGIGFEAPMTTDSVSGTKLPITFSWRGGSATMGGFKVIDTGCYEKIGSNNWRKLTAVTNNGTNVGNLNLQLENGVLKITTNS